MNESNKLVVPVSIIIAGALIAVGIYFSGQGGMSDKANKGGARGIIEDTLGNPDQPEVTVLPVTSADHIRGSMDAKIKIVEYSDTECPFCKRYHGTLKQIFDEYGASNKVAWVYRHFPLDMHKKAPKEAEATECAKEIGGADAFWKYIDLVYATTNGNDSLDHALLPKFAEQIGIDVAAFNTCLNSGKYAAKIQEAKTAGFNAGARGTPYTVLIVQNGRKTETVPLVDGDGNGLGALQYPALKKIIERLLAE